MLLPRPPRPSSRVSRPSAWCTLQEQLGVQLLEVEGRKAVLTEHGRILLQRAEQLLDQAENIDQVASSLNQGVEPVVRAAIAHHLPQRCAV